MACHAIGTFAVAEPLHIEIERGLAVGEPEHDLVLIERAGRQILLVDDDDDIAVEVVPEVDIDVIAIRAGGALDVAIVSRHLHRPGFAVLVLSCAQRAFRRLDGDVEPLPSNVPHLIVPGLLLAVRWRGVDFRDGGLDLGFRRDVEAGKRLLRCILLCRVGGLPDAERLRHLVRMPAREDPARFLRIPGEQNAIYLGLFRLGPAFQHRAALADRGDGEGGRRLRRGFRRLCRDLRFFFRLGLVTLVLVLGLVAGRIRRLGGGFRCGTRRRRILCDRLGGVLRGSGENRLRGLDAPVVPDLPGQVEPTVGF